MPATAAVDRSVDTQRPSRAPALPPLDPAYEALDVTHRAAQRMLVAIERLLEHLYEYGIDIQAEQAAEEILAFFDGPAAQHHRDEEAMVFPDVLASGDAILVGHVLRLQQDHGWIEEDWLALRPQIEAVATGYNGYDLATLRQALPRYATLYEEHIALEEQIIYPAAKALHKR
jgi:hemerythrin-like domain-containing protein